ncbi:MAG TPA: hypothetical protein VF793_16050 [Telluria sp.]|jgi:hypothetical protein
MNHSSQAKGGEKFWQRTASCLALCGIAFSSAASAATGYTGVYGGGPLYKHVASNISEIQNSGFSEVIVWSVEVSAAGDLNINGEFPLTSGGAYIGNNTWPNFAADLAAMKQGSAKRITLSVGSSNANPSDFDHVKALVQAQGTGPTSILYKTFQALKQALPSVDAIDFDDESTYDSATMTQFAVMLGNLGYHVTMSPYTNASFWTAVVSNINTQLPGTVDGVHLQAYSGGAGNNPCSGWNFGSVPVFPGLADTNYTPPTMQTQMQSWKNQCGITGGFLWLYDDVAGKTYNGQDEPQAYAAAINSALGTDPYPAGAVDVQALSSDGTAITNGGIDGGGYAYSSTLLGSSVTWNGSSFSLGAANTVDAWYNTTLSLPAGQYNTLNLLATGVQGSQAAQTFVVHYADGTSTTINQSLSDWFSPQNYAGESKAVTMAYRNNPDGTKDNRTFYLYGYSFAINSAKTVTSLTLPSNRNVVVLAGVLGNTAATAPGTPVSLSAAFTRAGVYTDGTTFAATGGLDGKGSAYSSNLLGASTSFNGVTYNYGTANANNDVSAAGQTIQLPAGQYASLRMMATAAGGNQASQSFKVTYTDGTSTTFTQSMSDWFTPQSYAGELDAVPMSYRDTNTGGRDSRTFHLYNYSFALNSAKTVQSVVLPNNASVEVLAMTLVP